MSTETHDALPFIATTSRICSIPPSRGKSGEPINNQRFMDSFLKSVPKKTKNPDRWLDFLFCIG
jgi:hypothetical protein